jgi:hypothetical protein
MWSFISQFGLATASLEYTTDFSPFLIGLVGVLWLSAGLMVWATLQHYRSPTWNSETGETAPAIAEDLQEAA